MLCVDGEARSHVVITACWYLVIRKLSARTATVHAMDCSRDDSIVALSYDLIVLDQYGADLAPRTRTELSQTGCLEQPVPVHLLLIRQRLPT